MSLDREEEVMILYALDRCGGKGSKARIIFYILEHHLMKPRLGDENLRGTETKVENDLAWARENLKEKGELIMPKHGTWQITDKGKQRLLRIAKAVFNKKPEKDLFCRYSEEFLKKLFELGKVDIARTGPTAS